MDHFLITRFNVRAFGPESPSDAWLRTRLKLFSSFTVPSVNAQSEANFVWVVAIDATSPAWLEDAIKTAATRAVVTRMATWDTTELASSLITLRRAQHLITTRLDNDDAICRSFVERVQESARRLQPGQFLNFPFGLQTRNGCLYRRLDPSSAFISRLEIGESPETVYNVSHDAAWRSNDGILQIRCAPTWLQVVHGENVGNAIAGVRVGKSAAKDFSIEAELADASRVELAADSVRSAARVALRVARKPSRLRWIPAALSRNRPGSRP